MNWLKTTIIALLALSACLVLYSEFLVDCENKRTGACSSKSQRMMGGMAFLSFAVASILFMYMYFKSGNAGNNAMNNVRSSNNSGATFRTNNGGATFRSNGRY